MTQPQPPISAPDGVPVTFTLGGIVRVLSVLVAVAVLWQLQDLAMLILIAFIIASAMLPLAVRAEKRGVGRIWTVAGLMLLLLGGIGVLGTLTAPVITAQVRQLATHAPEQVDHASRWLTAKLGSITGHPVQLPDITTQFGQFLRGAAGKLPQFTAGAAGAIAALILMIVLAGFMVIDQQRLRAGFLRFVPAGARETAGTQWDQVQERMGGYVAGMALIGAEKGVVLTAALWLLGIPSALLLGLLAGVLNFIPYVGFWSVFLLAELLAFNAAPVKGLWVFVIFMGHEWFKSGFLGPYLLGRSTKVHPAVMLVAIAAGTKLFGLAGTIVAAPLAAAVAVILENRLPTPAVSSEAAPASPVPARANHWSFQVRRRRPS